MSHFRNASERTSPLQGAGPSGIDLDPPEPKSESDMPVTQPPTFVGGLRIFEESDRMDAFPPDKKVLDKDSVVFRAVVIVIDLGLNILETEQGKRGIAKVGINVISNRKNFEHIYEDKAENMMWWVELFLARLRASFPGIILTSRIGGEGQTFRTNWAQGGVKMRQWDPKASGVMQLNKLIIYNLVRAGEKSVQNEQPHEAHVSAFEDFIFLMAVTVAHELIHFFVGFLTGYNRPETPTKVSFIPSLYNITTPEGIEMGESGRAWEAIVFGGIVETIEDRSSPLGAYQAGLFYVIDEYENAKKLDRLCVKQTIQRNFDFPLGTIGSSIPLADLDRDRRDMSEVRMSILPAGLVSAEARDCCGPTTMSSENLQDYIRVPPHTVRDREFTLLRMVSREPRYLFVAAQLLETLVLKD